MAKKEVKKVAKATALVENVVEVEIEPVKVCEEKECFHKLGKNTFAMRVPNGVVLRHRDSLVYLPNIQLKKIGELYVLV